jgi:hypothetical protein
MASHGTRILQLVRRIVSPYDQEEQGYPPTTTEGSVAGLNEKPLNVATTDQRALIPQHDKLLVFRALTGIDTVPALTRAGHSARTAPNLGIYTRVVRAEQHCGWTYHVVSLLINICLGVQIVVAAILTALGAADGPHAAVTAFGAINTIIAAILTYVKGSGLPDRLKYHKDEWKQVREYIEQREREFCLIDCSLDAQEEIMIVEEMYKSVKARLEAGKNPAGSAGPATINSNEAAPVHGRPRSVLSPSAYAHRSQHRTDRMSAGPPSEFRSDHCTTMPIGEEGIDNRTAASQSNVKSN